MISAPPCPDIVPALDLAPGTLVVAVGPGASGKSTFAATAAVDAVICLDSLRREIGRDEGDQSVTPAAVARQNRFWDCRPACSGVAYAPDEPGLKSR